MQSPGALTPLTARLFSTELLLWMVGVVFVFGVGYSALAKDTSSNTGSISKMEAAQAVVVLDISSIKSSLSGIDATRKAETKAVESRAVVVDRRMGVIESDIKAIEGDIKSVLSILRAAHK